MEKIRIGNDIIVCREIDNLGLRLLEEYPEIDQWKISDDMPKDIVFTGAHLDLLISKANEDVKEILFPERVFGLIKYFARSVNKVLVLNKSLRDLTFFQYGILENMYDFKSVKNSMSYDYGVGAVSGRGFDDEFKLEFEKELKSFKDFQRLCEERRITNLFSWSEDEIDSATSFSERPNSKLTFVSRAYWKYDDLVRKLDKNDQVACTSQTILRPNSGVPFTSANKEYIPFITDQIIKEMAGMSVEEFRIGMLKFNLRKKVIFKKLASVLQNKYGFKETSEVLSNHGLVDLLQMLEEFGLEDELRKNIKYVLWWENIILYLPSEYRKRLNYDISFEEDSYPIIAN